MSPAAAGHTGPPGAKQRLAAAMEELGYSDVSQLPQLELITWDTSEQKLLLEAEGVEVTDGYVDMELYQWKKFRI